MNKVMLQTIQTWFSQKKLDNRRQPFESSFKVNKIASAFLGKVSALKHMASFSFKPNF
jgi:hypothetical protein